jgi:hypothetical protein
MARSVRFKKLLGTVLVVLVFAAVLISAQLQLAGCAPRAATDDPSAAGEVGQDDQTVADAGEPFVWSSGSDCAICHVDEGASLSDPAQPQAFEHGTQECGSCHSEESILVQAHEGVTYDSTPAKRASLRTVDAQTCISCHGDLATVAQTTVASEALTDSNGLSVNPHERPVGERHEANPATCTDCHKVHSADLSRDAMKYCAQCHHRGIFQCGTCHPKDR